MILGHRTTLKKVNGKLVQQDAQKRLYQMYIDGLPEGTEIEIYISPKGEPATLGQLARCHKVIRVLALHAGLTFEAMKLLVKQKAGLTYTGLNADNEEEFKAESFGDCSYDEMDLAIRAATELGELMNCPVD